MKRRNFIKMSIFVIFAMQTQIFSKEKIKNKKTLVLIELAGGNDSLNTVVPYTSDIYYESRPNLAIKKNDLNIINNKFGLNKDLSFIYKEYKNNNVAIINGLGYDNPNLSHFKSIQLVETASRNSISINDGWINEYLDKQTINDKKPAHAVVIGNKQDTYLFSNNLNILKIKNIKKFIKESNIIVNNNNNSIKNEHLNFINKQNDIIKQANKSFKKYIKYKEKENLNSDSKIMKDLNEAYKIIDSTLDINVIKVSQKAYDTHSNQLKRQSLLLNELDKSIEYFVNKLKANNLFENVLILTYSEFGRRVKENGSMGTDHGTASSQFVIGGKIKGGIYGEYPSLNKLHKGNMIFTTHYASLYNTILSKYLNIKENKFKEYKGIDFI